MEKQSPYDKNPTGYTESITLEKKYVFKPNFLKVLGNVKGKKVLDLACGGGYYTRLMKENGALEVIGIDKSKAMSNIAKEKEKKNPLGIKYETYDVLNLPKIDEFDIITGTMLLHYSKTKEELLQMCKNIYKNLKKGGGFIGLNSNPFFPLHGNKKYGSEVKGKEPLKEGDEITIILHNKNKIFSFINYFWKKETYEQALKESGFTNIKWHELEISKEGIREKGKEFWKDYKKGVIIIKAEK